jgi:hypothetical protein
LDGKLSIQYVLEDFDLASSTSLLRKLVDISHESQSAVDAFTVFIDTNCEEFQVLIALGLRIIIFLKGVY